MLLEYAERPESSKVSMHTTSHQRLWRARPLFDAKVLLFGSLIFLDFWNSLIDIQKIVGNTNMNTSNNHKKCRVFEKPVAVFSAFASLGVIQRKMTGCLRSSWSNFPRHKKSLAFCALMAFACIWFPSNQNTEKRNSVCGIFGHFVDLRGPFWAKDQILL